MKTIRCRELIWSLACLLLLSCGGSGGGGVAGINPAGGGIGGTGVTTSGRIDGFGSIFVNGIEFETDAATVILDGEELDEAGLGLGMVVLVTGTLNEDGTTGTADTVIFDDDLQGPISSIAPAADGDSATLEILGVNVVVDRTATVFEGVTYTTLAVGDLVEVSGFADASGQVLATRIEKKSEFVSGSSEVELKGVVESLGDSDFVLGAFSVDYSMADLSDVPGGVLQNGMQVEVKGTLVGTVITATEIEEEDDIGSALDEDEELAVSGAITSLIDADHFSVDGVAVDASDASLNPEGLELAEGMIVEVKGVWDGNVLLAEEVELQGGELKVNAPVVAVSSEDNTISLQLHGGTVVVKTDASTQMEDKTEIVEPFRINDVAIGDFLRVEGLLSGDVVLAKEIDRDEPDDDLMQAPVESFVAGVSLTLLGVSYSTAGADFEDAGDESVDGSAFYADLEVGDLVRIVDEEPADGIADEVEFEDD
jgi:hypothetical protein